MLKHDNNSDASLRAGPSNFNSEWDKLGLLMWKNIRVIWSNWEQFLMTILVPIFFCSILVVLRVSLHIEKSPVEQYSILKINDYWGKLMTLIDERKSKINKLIGDHFSNPFIPEKIVGYAPNIYGYANIMKGASDDLGSLVVNSYETCDQLRSAIIQENLFAGVCFASRNSTDVQTDEMIGGLYPNSLKYSLIFPFACRIYHDTFIGISWNTNALYHFINRTDQRNIDQEDGGYVGYLREGFAPLQNAISMSYLKLVAALNAPDFTIPNVVMSRYPVKEFEKDDLIGSVDFSMSLMIVLGNFYPVLMFIAVLKRGKQQDFSFIINPYKYLQRIVSEKECTLKSYSKIMGINNYVHCIGWTLNYLLRALMSSFVIVVLLKVKWSNNISILERSNFFALLLVISVYNITSICFVLMVSPFYNELVFALSGTAITWFCTYMPYIMSLNKDHNSAWDFKLWVVIFHNTALGFVIESILDFELFGEGLNFENFFDTGPLRGSIPTGTLLCLMVMQCFLYIGISLYMEEIMPGKFGLRKRWYFLFTSKKEPLIPGEIVRRPLGSVSAESEGSIGPVMNRARPIIYEVRGGRDDAVVHLQNVCKAYNDEFVLRNINLQLADNEITILMGHNGSGKTTLLALMCALRSLTAGSIIIEGFDIVTDQRYACASVGLCLGSSLLYPDLTVEDQIRFFCYLKGFQGSSVERSLEHYLKATKLSDFRLEKTKYLPLGILQKLAICCALVGQSRVVLLDNPTTHMDLPARNLIWRLLETEKVNRTILITSTSANVLDGVGDRIAILSHGELQCDGTPVFIKKMYGRGYRLIITKGPLCTVKDVTRHVRKFIPKITPLCTLENEIMYDLNEANSDIFDQLTDSLEHSLSILGIESVTLRPVNIDDIFFKLAAANPSRENRTRLAEIMNGQSIYAEESKNLRFMEIKERVTGIRKVQQQFHAMWSQRLIFAIYFKWVYFRRMFFSSFFVVAAFCISSFRSNLEPMPPMEFTLEQYKSSVTIIERRGLYNELDPILARYRELILWLGVSGHKAEDIDDKLLSDHYLSKDHGTIQRMDQDHHVGVTFAPEYIIAWFNNVALHSVPLSLNLVHNAILGAINGSQGAIEISLEPLNNMQDYRDGLLRTTISTSHILPLFIAVCVCCIWNTITFTFVREIRSGYDKYQIMAGAKFVTYWFVNHAHDSIAILVTSCLITLTIMACQYQLHVGWDIYLWYTFIFTLCGWCIYALNYMIALFFNSPVHAFTFSLSIEAFSITCFCHIIEAFQKQYMDSIKSQYTSYFHILPLFSFCTALSAIYNTGELHRICRDERIRFISNELEDCGAKPNCCRKFEMFSFKEGILLEVAVMSVTIFICWFIVFMSHYKYSWKFTRIPEDDYDAQLKDHKRRHDDTKEYTFGEESSFQEQYQIQKMRKSELRAIPLICDRLGKNFGEKVVVDRMSLALHRFNCFCILGVSGCGVTTLFNLIAGFEPHTYGRILSNGRNIIHNFDFVQKIMGYGRQEMINFPELTVKSVLEYVCRLRSYPPQYIDEICVNLAKALGIFPDYDKHLTILSSGTLNRLNCACAVMGNPEIILLDMALAGIDSAGKREVWNVLKCMQSKGATILASTSSLRDCERYCTRVGFMSHGRLCLIGTPWNLSKLFANNHYLKVKLSRHMLEISAGLSNHHNYLYSAVLNKLTAFINSRFQNSVLKEQRGNNLIFLLPVQFNTISYIFKTLRQNAYYLSIEDFELSHNLLSQSFIEFWEKEYGLHLSEVRYSLE